MKGELARIINAFPQAVLKNCITFIGSSPKGNAPDRTLNGEMKHRHHRFAKRQHQKHSINGKISHTYFKWDGVGKHGPKSKFIEI